MVKAKKEERCCSAPGNFKARCRMESLIGIDERGQMVLPKDMREAAGIRPGDKLALIAWRKDGAVCCMTLIKADELKSMVRGKLGPLMKDIIS
jgi:AbrB family looped-hinge helix DNA binding protein